MTVLFGIPTNGRNALATKAVESAIAQTRPPDEVRVVEDGGQSNPFVWNGTAEVKITRRSDKGGPIAGRNEMMLSSDADIFVGLDDDSYFVDDDVIEIACETFRDNPKAGALYFEVLSDADRERKQRTAPYPVRTFVGCGHALRLNAAKEVQGYAPTPGLFYGEESDLSLRLLDRGWSTLKVPGLHVWHERALISRNRGLERRWGVLNDLTLIWRRCPKEQLLVRLFTNAAGQVVFSLRNPRTYLFPTLAGLVDFVRAWPAVHRSRAAVKRITWTHYRELS